MDFEKLTTDERIRLMEQLWESLDKDSEPFPLTDTERALLDERLDEMEREGPSGIPWEDVLTRIRGKKKKDRLKPDAAKDYHNVCRQG